MTTASESGGRADRDDEILLACENLVSDETRGERELGLRELHRGTGRFRAHVERESGDHGGAGGSNHDRGAGLVGGEHVAFGRTTDVSDLVSEQS